jgi:hypothetical protein
VTTICRVETVVGIDTCQQRVGHARRHGYGATVSSAIYITPGGFAAAYDLWRQRHVPTELDHAAPAGATDERPVDWSGRVPSSDGSDHDVLAVVHDLMQERRI